jgi:hypothetical protein
MMPLELERLGRLPISEKKMSTGPVDSAPIGESIAAHRRKMA